MGEGGWPWGPEFLTVIPSRKLQCGGRSPRLIGEGNLRADCLHGTGQVKPL